MASSPPDRTLVQQTAAVVAALFGVVTIVVGGRVLTGRSDPGYVVFRPLLVYNTVMGAGYLAAGLAIWRSLEWGKYAAAAVFVANLLVLVAIVFLYRSGRAIATDSLRAMTFRTVVWLGLWLALVWTAGRYYPPSANG